MLILIEILWLLEHLSFFDKQQIKESMKGDIHMSIFDNIIFDEFTLLEGEQAEAYKKHKAEEKKKAEDEYISRAENRDKRLSDAVQNDKRRDMKTISDDEWDDHIVSKAVDAFSNKQLQRLGKRYSDGDKTVRADVANATNSAIRHYTKEYKKNK